MRSNTTLIAITPSGGARTAVPTGTRHTLSPAPAGRVTGASHCLYLPISGGGINPKVNDVVELTPDRGAVESFKVLRVDQIPGRLGHRAVWLGPV